MFKKYRIIFFVVVILAVFIYLNPSNITTSVEKMDINSGIGVDMINSGKESQYMISISPYTFNDKNKNHSMIMSGKSNTATDTRASRQMQSNHKFIAALQKVVILGEDMGRFGIENSTDLLFSNQFMNDMSWLVVCKGKAMDTLQYKVDDFPSSADYIDGLIDNADEMNFFTDNYKIMDMYVRVDAEGRNLVLPYIEVKDRKIEITGLALFKGYKMVKEIDIAEAKLLNLLRENKARGILEMQENVEHYLSLYGESKRKVTCKKSGSNYKFTINITYNGDVVANSLIKDLDKKPQIISKLEKDLAKQTEKQCEGFIERMQKEYKVDCLELGRVACAKYGRDSGVDWNEIISKSDIEVKVKIKVTGFGRGIYAE